MPGITTRFFMLRVLSAELYCLGRSAVFPTHSMTLPLTKIAASWISSRFLLKVASVSISCEQKDFLSASKVQGVPALSRIYRIVEQHEAFCL